MRSERRIDVLVAGALAIVAGAFLIYATLVLRWFAAPAPGAPISSPERAARAAAAGLGDARREFRRNLLDPRAHLRLADALWRAGRPVDAFYVMLAARQFFSASDFRQAHAEELLRVGGAAAADRARLKSAPDDSEAIRIHADVVRNYPDTPEARDSLDQLSKFASHSETAAGGETSRLAWEELQDLYKSFPKRPAVLAALGGAAFGRGEPEVALALAREAWDRKPGHAGAAKLMAIAALRGRDVDEARRWLNAAWDGDPDDLYSAVKLAEIYDRRRAEPEAALPFYLALYRQNPDYADIVPAETRIREILDARSASLLRDVPIDKLGDRFMLDDASLRAEACVRATEARDPRWISALGKLLDDDVELVRRNADTALYRIAQARPGDVLAHREEWMSSDATLVRVRALNLFADLQGKNAFPAVAEALRDADPAVRAFAKVMVLDRYFPGMPEAGRAGAKYLASEKDPHALTFLARFAAVRRR